MIQISLFYRWGNCGFREVNLLVQGHRVGSDELGCKPRLSDSCYASSSTVEARLTHVHKTDIYFSGLWRTSWRCCRGDLTCRNGKGFLRRNTEQQNNMCYQNTKSWMAYWTSILIIFYFGHLNAVSFSVVWILYMQRRNVAPIPKVSREHSALWS